MPDFRITIERVNCAICLGGVTASTWLITNGVYVFQYLYSYGYGERAANYSVLPFASGFSISDSSLVLRPGCPTSPGRLGRPNATEGATGDIIDHPSPGNRSSKGLAIAQDTSNKGPDKHTTKSVGADIQILC